MKLCTPYTIHHIHPTPDTRHPAPVETKGSAGNQENHGDHGNPGKLSKIHHTTYARHPRIRQDQGNPGMRESQLRRVLCVSGDQSNLDWGSAAVEQVQHLLSPYTHYHLEYRVWGMGYGV
jgi:hypothetical protein